ncbi:MAG TPA: hypothetical protein VFE36_04690 [Candidatus Baltobacteraceae bacterium]|jgi:hypothetical protein|nr:hypothetical protein [Candidatus Baltobacteraceae bacterium]
MVFFKPKAPAGICTGKLLWIWAAYAFAMAWMWNALTAAGLPAAAIWALAGLAGTALLLATREI